jgi:hypothetical protein
MLRAGGSPADRFRARGAPRSPFTGMALGGPMNPLGFAAASSLAGGRLAGEFRATSVAHSVMMRDLSTRWASPICRARRSGGQAEHAHGGRDRLNQRDVLQGPFRRAGRRAQGRLFFQTVQQPDKGDDPLNGDGLTRIMRPGPPADFADRTCRPRDARGNPVGPPLEASIRPRIAPNGDRDPLYTNDRSNGDYNPNPVQGSQITRSVGSV